MSYHYCMDKRKNKAKKLRRRQLDQLYEKLQPMAENSNLAGGWIRSIREALGISPSQFGRMLGISRQAYQKLEASEDKQTISLEKLSRLAEAVNCRVVYAIVPNSPYNSLDAILKDRAHKEARKLVGRVSRTMALEDQAVSKKELEQQIQEIADDLIGNLDKRLWD